MSAFDEFWNSREAALADPTETTSEYAKRASEEAWNAALDAVTDLADSWRADALLNQPTGSGWLTPPCWCAT